MRMFPLSSVLFPGGAMPLHVFESRYLKLVAEAIDDDRTFGVVLIERGPEVGGGDSRFTIGTAARIVRAGTLEDDRMAVVAVGTKRIRVEEWLTDEPYPVALVSDLLDSDAAGDIGRLLEGARRAWQKVLGLASELGADVGAAQLDLPEDPIDALWTLCAVSPLEQIDRQRLLETDQPDLRASRLTADLEDKAAMFEARLAEGAG